MSRVQRKLLGIIGAGPKGLAVAVKSKVLSEFGFPVDRVVLIEKNAVAANWSGDFGFTNGEMKLGTSPEKDLVFPLQTQTGERELDRRIQQRLMQFSWTAYLVTTGQFADWVDRGRPAPCHHLWASYLKWVADQLSPQVEVLQAEVVQIDLSSEKDHWLLRLKNSERETLSVDRLMLTGPGKTRGNFLGAIDQALPKGVYDLQSFWQALKSNALIASGRLAVVGAGENAASALLALANYAPNLQIDLISPRGFIATRSENFYENQFYSHPERSGWRDLKWQDRVEFIERTDLGVFSTHAMQILNEQRRHNIVPGRVVRLGKAKEELKLELEYNETKRELFYRQVILATGFDQITLLQSMFSQQALSVLAEAIGGDLSKIDVRGSIESDLSLRSMSPRLYLPMLAGINQGPGFSNLSCLGLLSDRILLRGLHADRMRLPRLLEINI